jgi:hypothetical protein
MIEMPDTYEKLIKSGISKDFSMGYSSHPGFRASYCLPFSFFNLKTNMETSLTIIPFAFMDVCFRDNQKNGKEKALIEIKKIISSIKKVNGMFVSLWHNETLADDKNAIGWRYIFEKMLEETRNGN